METLTDKEKKEYVLKRGWVNHWAEHNWVLPFLFDGNIPDNAGWSLERAYNTQISLEKDWINLGWYLDENDNWKQSEIINKYPFGSRVYGSHNRESDFDYVVVVKEYYKNLDPNTHVYTVQDFQSALDNHDIPALECYFLSDDKIIKNNHKFTFELNKFKLRRSVSTISSN